MRGLIPISLICMQLGCDALWGDFGYSNPNNCSLNPGVCGAGMECNGALESCEMSAALPTSSQRLWYQQARLSASDRAYFDIMGFSTSISAETALVGAHLADNASTYNAGAAYVFVRDAQSGLWGEQAKLVASDFADSDYLGFSVSLSGDTALLSAHTSDQGGALDQGAAYVFVRDPGQGTWTQQAKLVADDGLAYDLFGGAVSLRGDTALIGASQSDSGAISDCGAAYVFVRNPQLGTWVQQKPKLVPNDIASGDGVGIAVSLSGNTALVGAYYADPRAQLDAGAAYVFVRNSGTGVFTQQAKLTADDGAVGDHFGVAVSIDGDTVIVGAPEADSGDQTDAGAAYVFVRNPGTGVFMQQAKLVAPDGVAGAKFGKAAALFGDRAAITANYAPVNGESSAGAVYVFIRAPGQTTWALEAKLATADAAANDLAGTGVALLGNTLLLGAPGKAVGGTTFVGAAYVFELARPDGNLCTAARDCRSRFCIDGVCCNSACGGGDPSDCQACSAAAGGNLGMDGICGPRRPGRLCRASVSAVDPPESCDGQALTCPPDVGG